MRLQAFRYRHWYAYLHSKRRLHNEMEYYVSNAVAPLHGYLAGHALDVRRLTLSPVLSARSFLADRSCTRKHLSRQGQKRSK